MWFRPNEIFPGSKCLRHMATKRTRSLSFKDVNPNLKSVDDPFACQVQDLRGKIITKAHVGDAHAMGQSPITFIRQVMALVLYPSLMGKPLFPNEAVERAKEILKHCSGESVGSYTDGTGIELIRKQVAEYIEKRDGVPSDWQNIILTSASEGILGLLRLFACTINNKRPGVMIPVPHYPHYVTAVKSRGFQIMFYYLNEDKGWSIESSELQKSFEHGSNTCVPRIIIVNNPGNPGGQVFSKKTIEEIVKFACRNELFVISDESYQDAVYAEDSKFYSFKKVSSELEDPYNKLELASVMSCSKGYACECGVRGGYVEVFNMCPKVKDIYIRFYDIMSCPSVLGQVVISTLVKQPEKENYELFQREKRTILDSLKVRAEMVVSAFNNFKGYRCNQIKGSMYAFPRIDLPSGAIEAANAAKLKPDEFYMYQLLKRTGIHVIPGSRFGQRSGTYHLRSTILLKEDQMKLMLEKLNNFNEDFMTKYQ